MTRIVDRRQNGKNKSAVNRQKFIRRFRHQIKKAIADAVSERSITDLDKGETVSIPTKDTSEPFFHHGQGGHHERIYPGVTFRFILGRLFRPILTETLPGISSFNRV